MAHNQSVRFNVQPGGYLQGRLRVPGDKSMSHRSIMLGALAEGVTRVNGFLQGDDCLATLQAFRQMNVDIAGPYEDGTLTINGVGLKGLKAPVADMDMGNSGTAMRLMAGLMAGQSFDSRLTGDASLSKRPMKRVTDPLTKMGAAIQSMPAGNPPLLIKGSQTLQGFHYEMPVASAQVKSALLLAGLYAQGETSVTEPAVTRDHTERMLQGFGYTVVRDGQRVSLRGGGQLQAADIDVPADISSAAFFLVGASIAEGSDLLLEHVGINPTRTGVIEILRLMGADIDLSNERLSGGEPVADIRVRSAPLKGIRVPESLVPLAIDEFPVLFVAAACADGETQISGASELRVKECDRIQVMADGLQACGVSLQTQPDGMTIQGATAGFQGGALLESHLDHRIAMAFSIAGLKTQQALQINDCATVNTSFPGFVDSAASVGLKVQVQ